MYRLFKEAAYLLAVRDQLSVFLRQWAPSMTCSQWKKALLWRKCNICTS